MEYMNYFDAGYMAGLNNKKFGLADEHLNDSTTENAYWWSGFWNGRSDCREGTPGHRSVMGERQ